MVLRRQCFTLAAAGLFVTGGGSQQMLWQRVGTLDQIQVGGASVFLGDLNADGYADFAHLAKGWPPPTVPPTRVLVVSGRDGQTLRIDDPSQSNYAYWSIVPAGDVDRDGIRDYAGMRFASNGPPWGLNIVEVRSGRDGTVFWQATGPFSDEFGSYLAGDLDVDGDGVPDLVIGSPRESPQGALYVRSSSGQLLYKRTAMPHWGLGSMEDLDGDGCDEILVGCGTDPSVRGGAFVHSGRTGQLIMSVLGDPGDGLGSGRLMGCGDIDGDGVPDFVASSEGGLIMNGVVYAFSGRDGRRLFAARKGVSSTFGRTLDVGDLDLDGVADLLVGITLCGGQGAVEWYSLRDGSLVTRVCRPSGPPTQTGFGEPVTIGPPQPGSPFPVFVIGEPRYPPRGALSGIGRLHMYRAVPPGVASLGRGCAGTLGSAPRIGLTGRLERGLDLHLSGAPPGAPAVLLLGLSSTTWGGAPLPYALDPFGFPGCTLQTSVELAAVARTGTTGIDAGWAAVRIPFPIAAGSPSLTLHGQWLVPGAGRAAPGAVTGGLSWPH